MSHFNLQESKSPQSYGLGIKEVWEIPEDNHKPGLVIHTLGYHLQASWNEKTFSGFAFIQTFVSDSMVEGEDSHLIILHLEQGTRLKL